MEKIESLINNIFIRVKNDPTLVSNCHLIAPLIDEELKNNNISSSTIIGNLWIKILSSQKTVSYLLKDGGTGHAWNKVIYNNEAYLLDISVFHQAAITIPSKKPIFLPYNVNDQGCMMVQIYDLNDQITHEVAYQDATISNYYAHN